MANKSLNEKYDIPFLSEWKHKDGGIYTALKVEHSFKGICGVPIVAYMKRLTKEEAIEWQEKGILNFFIRTVFHFKDSFIKVDENVKDGI